MKTVLLSALVLFTVLESVSTASEPNALRTRIPRDAVIQGYPCAKGDAWFYPDGSLNQCTLSRTTVLGDLQLPRRSVIELWPGGATRHLTLPHNAVISGYRLRGGALLGRGSSQDDVTAFYPSGRLRSIVLAGDQTIQGVPCGAGAATPFADSNDGGNHVDFYEDGRLQSCSLTRDYGGQKNGQRLVLSDEPGLLTAGR
ncbi:MAG: hypothetical protein ABSA94_08940 [Acidobacteriaceae bacterium]|jgi:hypothetical protein